MLRHRRSTAFQDTLVMVMAGGRGERLYPLTRDRTKGAVPFGGQYRLIDFTLSNCVNSDLCRICVLPQYKSASLERHLRLGWSFLRPERDEGIEVLPPQQRVDEHWYRGTADAVYQNIYTLRQYAPAQTLILSSDHLYRMDYRLLLEHHLQAGAELTIACMSADLGEARRFGVIQAGPEGQVIGFEEKPAHPKPMLLSPGRALVSMGIYVFDTQALIDLLEEDASQAQSTRDFGRDLIPRMVREGRRVQACDVAAAQGKVGFYWRDIGLVDAYWEASMDLLGERPAFALYQPDWPLYTWQQALPPARIVQTGQSTEVADSLVCPGVVIEGARVHRAILSPGVEIGYRAEVYDSVLMDGVKVGPGARLHRVIIDKGVVVPPGVELGINPEADRQRFTLTPGGVVVLGKETRLDRGGGDQGTSLSEEAIEAAESLLLPRLYGQPFRPGIALGGASDKIAS
ncbi:MAG: glucose-1-phosphate adenylyltransferase [Candidatus Latescibacteria bacterium]|nr:glucose-1-phosphate adenylyltransferase [Candidatus Latescibacterota bacterium]